MLAHPFRGQIDPTAVSALFDLFFDHLLTEDLEFDTERLITLPFRGSRLSGNFFFFLRNHRVSVPGCRILRLASHGLVLTGIEDKRCNPACQGDFTAGDAIMYARTEKRGFLKDW
jgi:hypothetical protein